MGTIDYGTQTISFDFNEPGKSENFNKLNYKILEPGFYEGGLLSYVDATHISVDPFLAYVQDSTVGVSVRIETEIAVNLLVAPSAPYCVLRFDWANVANNYADIIMVAEVDINVDDLVIGRAVYDVTTLETFFDYSRRPIPIITTDISKKLEFTVSPQEPYDNTVSVQGGTFNNGVESITITTGNSPIISNTTLGRNDIVYLASNGTISVTEGVDSASPVTPDYGTGYILCEIQRGAGKTYITGADIIMVGDDKSAYSFEIADLAGTGRTIETVKDNADDIVNLAGAGRTTETVKQNADDIASLITGVPTVILEDGANTTLPTSPAANQRLSVIAKGAGSSILQPATHAITYQDVYYSTLGTGGSLDLEKKGSATLIYIGADVTNLEQPVKLTDTTLPTGAMVEAAISDDGTYIAVGGTSQINIYKRVGSTLSKLTNPGSLPTSLVTGIEFSPTADYMVIKQIDATRVRLYDRTGDAFSYHSDPSFSGGWVGGISWSVDGNYALCTQAQALYLWSISGSTWTQYILGSTVPINTTNYNHHMDNTGTYVSVVNNTGIFLTKRTGNAFPTPSGNSPCTINLQPTGPRSATISDDGVGGSILVATGTSGEVWVYTRSGDAFTRQSIASPVSGTAYDSSLSEDGRVLVVSHSSSPFVTVYRREGTTFTKLTQPATIPSGASECSRVSADGSTVVAASSSSGYIYVYNLLTSVANLWSVSDYESRETDLSSKFN